jgi:hypothetical protein
MFQTSVPFSLRAHRGSHGNIAQSRHVCRHGAKRPALPLAGAPRLSLADGETGFGSIEELVQGGVVDLGVVPPVDG